MIGHGACPTRDELVDWWIGDLEVARADEVEVHLLACGRCTRRADEVVTLAAALVAGARAGGVSGVVTPALLGRLERDGVRVHRYLIEPGQVVPCSVWPEDDVMAAVLALDPAPAAAGGRVDLLAQAGDGPPVRHDDVPVDPATATVTVVTPAGRERARTAMQVGFRLLRDGGATVHAYTLAHQPWTGPGSPR